MKVLIVDDCLQCRQVNQVIIQSLDMPITVVEGENGQQGFEVFIQEKPDIVITDYQMPIADGEELARAIRETNKEIPIFLVSASTDLVVDESLFTEIIDKMNFIDTIETTFYDVLKGLNYEDRSKPSRDNESTDCPKTMGDN